MRFGTNAKVWAIGGLIFAVSLLPAPVTSGQRARADESAQRAVVAADVGAKMANNARAKAAALAAAKIVAREQVEDAFPGSVDIFMVGTDMKQPTFSHVRITGVVELPNGTFLSGTDGEKRSILINPSQIAAARSAVAR